MIRVRVRVRVRVKVMIRVRVRGAYRLLVARVPIETKACTAT